MKLRLLISIKTRLNLRDYIDVISNKGIIKIHDSIYTSKYKKEVRKALKYFKPYSINRDITLSYITKI